jgi:two-component system NtrC family sensor kinase
MSDLIIILVAIIELFVGLGVFLKNKRSNVNKAFLGITAALAFWSFSTYISWHCPPQTQNLWDNILYYGPSFVPAFFLWFILSLSNDRAFSIKQYIYIFFPPFLLSLLAYFRLMIKESINPWTYTLGIGYHIFSLYFVFYMGLCFFKLFQKFVKSSSLQKLQIEYVLVSTLTATVISLIFNLVLPMIGITRFTKLGPSLSGFALVSIIAYAIVRYRLMDIKVAITRTGIFVAVYTLVLGLPFVVVFWLKEWLIENFSQNWWALPLGLMAALATVGPFIYIYLNRKAEEKLLREQKRYQNILKQASMGMTRIRNLRKLLNLITHIVTKTVKIEYAGIYLYDQEKAEYVLVVSRDKGSKGVLRLDSQNPLIKWIVLKRVPLIYEEVKRKMQDSHDATYQYLEANMRMLNASVVIPSFFEDKFMGFIVLGDKISGQVYTPEDLDVFLVLANQAALAIENAQFYEDAKKLQLQIAQAEKMATIGTMADGLSHQINNRFYALSLIAGDSIDTIKHADTSQCSPEIKKMIQQIGNALERVQANVMQGAEVVKGILKYSRTQEAAFEAINLDQIIDGTLDMVQYKVKLSEIDLIRDYPKNLPKIAGNLAQLEEVFFNFIDNAYDAIVERRDTLKEPNYRGKIIISARVKMENTVEIILQDNGLGIKEENLKKVFTPFFTTKISARQGTGLGLYVIKRIITDNHKGTINFSSQYHSGTRFTMELPIAKQGG